MFLFRVKMLTGYWKYADISENDDDTPTFLVKSLSLRVVPHTDQIGGQWTISVVFRVGGQFCPPPWNRVVQIAHLD